METTKWNKLFYMEKFNKIYLLVGGNLDNTTTKYRNLFRLLEQNIGKIIQKSSFYKSNAWGFISNHTFINLALLMETSLLPEELLIQTQAIENVLGRTKKSDVSSYSDRSMDIDILFYNDIIFESDNLCIPHVHIAERMFVLIPLCEIAADFKHPVSKKSIQELKNECKDTLQIEKMPNFLPEN